jgi:hypothetical protein
VSERLETRAEVLKLARLLDVEPDELRFAERLPSRALRSFREAATERLFENDAEMFRRIGATTRLVPSQLVATIAQRSFGPLLCARAAGALDTHKALDVLSRMPPAFVAEATAEVDPRRVADLIAAVPEDVIVAVARILGERGEYVTMGRFLAYVPDRAIVSAIGALSDEALLRTAFVLEHKDRLDHAVSLLAPGRLRGLILSASKLDLWPEALDLLEHLSDERRGPIADLFAEQHPDVITGLVHAVAEAGIWDSLLPTVRLMSRERLELLASVPVFGERSVLEAVIAAVADSDQGLWRELAPLVGVLPEQTLQRAAEVAGELSPERIRRVLDDASGAPEALPPLVSLIAAMDETRQRRVVTEIVHASARAHLWTALTPLLELLPERTRTFVADAASALSEEDLAALVADAAAAPHALLALLVLADQAPEELQHRIAGAIGSAPPDLLSRVATALREPDGELPLDRLPPIIRAAAERALA